MAESHIDNKLPIALVKKISEEKLSIQASLDIYYRYKLKLKYLT